MTIGLLAAIALAQPSFGKPPASVTHGSPPPTAQKAVSLPDGQPDQPSRVEQERPPQTIVVQPAAAPKNWDYWVEKLIQFAAVLIGGIWVWVNYLLNRTHRARLEGRVCAEVLPLAGGLVKITLGLKNVGLSKVDLLKEGTAIRVASLDPKVSAKTIWRDRMTIPIWESVDWVEPGESCEEQHLLKIPLVSRVPIKFELYVNCEYRSFPLRRRVTQALRGSYVLPPSIGKDEVPT